MPSLTKNLILSLCFSLVCSLTYALEIEEGPSVQLQTYEALKDELKALDEKYKSISQGSRLNTSLTVKAATLLGKARGCQLNRKTSLTKQEEGHVEALNAALRALVLTEEFSQELAGGFSVLNKKEVTQRLKKAQEHFDLAKEKARLDENCNLKSVMDEMWLMRRQLKVEGFEHKIQDVLQRSPVLEY